jgi:hypothetical protein
MPSPPSPQGDGDPGPQPLLTVSLEAQSVHLAALAWSAEFESCPLPRQLTLLTEMVRALTYAYIERLDRRRDD